MQLEPGCTLAKMVQRALPAVTRARVVTASGWLLVELVDEDNLESEYAAGCCKLLVDVGP